MPEQESLKAVLNFNHADQIIQFEPGYWPETLERWRREGLGSDEQPWEATGITFYARVPVNVRMYPPCEQEVLKETASRIVTRNEDGVLMETFRGNTSIPNFLDFPVKTLRDFEELAETRLNPNDPARFPEDWSQAVVELNKRDYVLVMGRTEISFLGWPRTLMGFENLMLAYYDQPELVHATNRHRVEFLKQIYGRLMEEVAFDFVFVWEDMAYKNGPMISSALFREFMMPYYQEFISFVKGRRDYKFVVDSDGDVSELIPLFIEAGMDGMLPFECAAGMNICKIREEYPGLIICGGIDKREIAKGRAAINRELESKLPFMFERGGYLPSMDHHVHPEVGFDDFKYYIARVRELYGASVAT